MNDQWLPYALPVTAVRRTYEVERPRPPMPVRIAIALMTVRALWAVVGVVTTVATIDSLRGRLAGRFPSLSAKQIDLVTAVGVGTVCVIVGALVLLYSVLAARVRGGGNTARTVAIALSWLAIAGDFYLATRSTSAAMDVAIALDAAVNLAIVVLLAATESWNFSNRYRLV